MRINVTQEHIDRGVRGDCAACPIALATTEVIHERVGVVGLHIIDNDGIPIKETTVKMRQFMDNFDDGKPVQPFSFNLKL